MSLKRWLGCGSLVAVLVLGVGYVWWGLSRPLVAKHQQARYLLVPQGSTLKNITARLTQDGLLCSPGLFAAGLKLIGYQHHIQAGEYLIEPGMSGWHLMRKMVKGEMINHVFTLVEGWTFQQVLEALRQNHYIEHRLKGLTGEAIMAALGHPGEDPEGRFAPDSYLFSGRVSDVDILRRAYVLMANRLHKAWQGRQAGLPYHCPYGALIMASLIEKETALREEKPLMVGVLINRLRKGMRLQVDPSVLYAWHKKNEVRHANLTLQDLKLDSQYNTYRRHGLPPTPICMPSEESIVAALQPLRTDYLYYVANGKGGHSFLLSLQEHLNAKSALAKQNRR